jgi:branched-chain amino acid transport system ATP-binding protein
VSQRIVVLNFGKQIADGTPEEVRRNPAVLEAYLGKDEDDSTTGEKEAPRE